MGTVTLWLTVAKKDQWGDRNLWCRKVEMAFAPGVGDRVGLLWNEEDQETFLHDEVFKRYWEHDGSLHLEFRKRVIDPEPGPTMHQAQYLTSWYTERDGDLEARLRASGWKTWSEMGES